MLLNKRREDEGSRACCWDNIKKESMNKKCEMCSLVLANQGTELIAFGSVRKACLGL